ncbi:MAG: hypothetical protein EOP52_00690 [Sphingobacteriales bacterium]|nr:MAG: hypothetical protein EOP52_00690 [Sphingobacteriales bacterium]
MVRVLAAFWFAFLILGGTGCNLINPAEEIPTYIQVDSFQFFNTRADSTGGTTHKIRSVFVTYRGQNVGGFDLPAKIPVLASGTGELILSPGVDNTGLFSYQLQYPHYKSFITNLTAAPGQTTTVAPQTGYMPATRFSYLETFENSNDFVTLSGSSVSNTTTPGEVLDGNRSGVFSASGTTPTTVVMSRTFNYLAANSDGFLELDYQGNAFLSIGVIADNQSQPNYFFTLSPSPERNKIYVSLESAIAKLGNSASGLRILFQVYTQDGQTSGKVVVDNVKILVF